MPSRPDDLISTDVDLALERLRAGGLVAIPTETVYGLAADAENEGAVRRIFEAKGRPADHPLIVHLSTSSWERSARDWATVTPAAARLTEACWPGPLTVLVERGRRVLDIVIGGRSTVGLRVPAHPLAQELLDRFGGGLAAPSANRFGRVSPTTAQHVVDDLVGALDPERDLILDGGPSDVGVESTIVDASIEPPQILRAGAITVDDVERILAGPVAAASGPSRASGMLASHYAPACDVVLADGRDSAVELADRLRAEGRRAEVLDRTDDLVVAARRLYDDLRAADRADVDVLVVVEPEPTGLGLALRDRLTKAAATRPDRPSRAG